MGSHIFETFGVRIFWQVGSLSIKKFRTICGKEERVKYTCSTFRLTNVSINFRITYLKGFIR